MLFVGEKGWSSSFVLFELLPCFILFSLTLLTLQKQNLNVYLAYLIECHFKHASVFKFLLKMSFNKFYILMCPYNFAVCVRALENTNLKSQIHPDYWTSIVLFYSSCKMLINTDCDNKEVIQCIWWYLSASADSSREHFPKMKNERISYQDHCPLVFASVNYIQTNLLIKVLTWGNQITSLYRKIKNH